MAQRPTSLDFLQAVYLNETLPLSVRLRAAIEAARYEQPKLSAVGVGNLTGDTFAERLDCAIARSSKLFEAKPLPQNACVS